jgi:hypothetical protein
VFGHRHCSHVAHLERRRAAAALKFREYGLAPLRARPLRPVVRISRPKISVPPRLCLFAAASPTAPAPISRRFFAILEVSQLDDVLGWIEAPALEAARVGLLALAL